MNKNIEEALQIIGVSIFLFMLTIDIVFPVVVFVLKALLLICGAILFIFGIFAIIKSIFNKKSNEQHGV